VKVKYTFIADIPDDHISEQNDVLYEGYLAIEKDYDSADSADDFRLEFEVIE
jgi:hypothetical protein